VRKPLVVPADGLTAHGRLPPRPLRLQVRVWEAPKSADGASALPGVPKAEMNVGGPVLDTQWMETGGHVFAATALKKVMLWDLAANTASEIAAVSCCCAGVAKPPAAARR